MGFLNKNAVAAGQLAVLAHQRIFAVSADLHGIMDTAQNGRISDLHRAVCRRLPIGKRLSWAVVSPQPPNGWISGWRRLCPRVCPSAEAGLRRLSGRSSKWEGIGLHRLCPRVCPSANARLGGCIAAAQNGRVSDHTGCVPAFAHRQTPAWAVVSPQLKMGGYRITPAVSPRLPIGKRPAWAVVSPQLKMGGYRITPAVSPRLPIGKRPPGRLYRRSSKWEGLGLHRLCPRVCPSANARPGRLYRRSPKRDDRTPSTLD